MHLIDKSRKARATPLWNTFKMYKTRLSVSADEDGLAGQHGVGAPLERVDHGLPLAAAVVQKQ